MKEKKMTTSLRYQSNYYNIIITINVKIQCQTGTSEVQPV